MLQRSLRARIRRTSAVDVRAGQHDDQPSAWMRAFPSGNGGLTAQRMHPLQQPLQGGYRAAGAEPLTAGGVAQGGVEQAGALGARLQRLGQH